MAYNGEEILHALGLSDYYPSKLSYMNATTIRTHGETIQNSTNYGLKLVNHLLKCDYKELEKITTKHNEINISEDAASKTDTSKRFAYSKNRVSARRKFLHPMDVMTILLSCCDVILRQILIEKLVSVRVSVPIILPSVRINGSLPVVLNWSLKNLSAEISDNKVGHKYLIRVPNPIISFMRIGSLHRSKSKLLSTFVTKTSHAVFYHRECQNALAKRGPSSGTVEIAWFQSSDNSDEDFQFNCKLFTILNLRGDAREFPIQTQFLYESSSFVVIMTDSVDSLTKWHDEVRDKICWKRSKIVIAIVSEKAHEYNLELDTFTQNCSIIDHVIDITTDSKDERPMTFLEWRSNLRGMLGKFLNEYKEKIFALENIFPHAESLGYLLEDNTQSFENSMSIADSFVKSISIKMSPPPAIIPLQGEPLKMLSELQKKIRRNTASENESTESFVNRLQNEIKKQRRQQCETICKLTDFEKNFYKILRDLRGNDLMITLMLVKLGLNNNYDITGQAPGLERIICELGQMFEAVHFNDNQSKTGSTMNMSELFMSLSEIRDFALRAAELLLLGQPLELLNGTASYVPITWIQEVFNRVAELTKNGKVFVLSVIGVQSSGKSTLLNALFGLNFPTSAGKCTSGLYCHLLPIDKTTIKSECEYVMILDAEGFRAPEFVETSTERDNEMATFIVGLSDLTIVNIDGENWSDMKDILQIVVHALLRIRQTKNKIEFMPSCVFVYQKISAPDFRDKIKEGNQIQLKYLDTMTEAAAQREGYNNITAFSDVVIYNDEADSYFLPNIWMGNPPFATISSEYCSAVASLKTNLLKRTEHKNVCLTFSDFYLRIADLREAILQENFVFNFRDTKNALAFQSLSASFSQIQWHYKISNRHNMTKITNKIVSAGIYEDLNSDKEKLLEELDLLLAESYKKAEDALNQALSSEIQKDSAKIFRDNFQSMLRCLKELEDNEAHGSFENVFKIQRKKLENCVKFEAKLNHILIDLCRTKDDDIPTDKVSEYLDDLWEDKFLAEKKRFQDSIASAKVRIRKAIEKCLTKDALREYKSNSNPSMPVVEEEDIFRVEMALTNIAKHGILHVILPTVAANMQCKEQFKRCKEYLKTLKGVDFEESQVKNVFKYVSEFFGQPLNKRHETSHDNESASAESRDQNNTEHAESETASPGSYYSKQYIAKYFAAIGHYTHDKLCAYQRDFIEKTDAYFNIETQHRKRMKDLFLSRKEAECTQVRTSYLSRILHIASGFERHRRCSQDFSLSRREAETLLAIYTLEEAEKAVFQDLNLTISKILVADDKSFANKKTFMAKQLTELAKHKNAVQMSTYFTDFDSFCGKELKNYLKHFLEDNNFLQKIASRFKMEIKAKIKKIQEDITSSLDKCDNKSLKSLLYTFRDEFAGKIAFRPENVLVFFPDMNKKDIKYEDLREIVDTLKSDLDSLYEAYDPDMSQKIKPRLELNSAKEIHERVLKGCCEKCPFCSAPCLEQTKNHCDHVKHHSLHYPLGLSGTMQFSFSSFKYTLMLDSCPALIQSEKTFANSETSKKYNKWYHRWFSWLGANSVKYKNYQEIYPEWNIGKFSDMREQDNDYWKWLLSKFGDEFAKKYGVSCPKVPNEWRQIKPEDAVNSICALLQ